MGIKLIVEFRKWKRKRPIEWPGKMLQAIASQYPDQATGVEDWLTYLGLEAVTEAQDVA